MTPSRVGISIAMLFASACSRPTAENREASSGAAPPSTSAATMPTSPRSPPLGPAQFHLTSDASGTASQSFVAATDDSAPPCRFHLSVETPRAVDGAPFSMTTVTVGREPGSDCTRFLRRLGTTLAFSGLLPHPASTDTLRATFAVLGTHQTREEDPEVGPGFTSTPRGNWTCGKLFLADGEGEVFFNFSASEGIGEFSIKDEDYAEIVTREFAKIFLPVSGERPR